MNIAFCDDSKEYNNTVEDYLDRINDKALEYDMYSYGEELIKVYEKGDAHYDAIFLDMEMGGLNGIETANRIRMIDKKVIIVFVTCYTKYMKDSFECLPFRFLVKPVSFDDFLKVYKEVATRIDEEKSTLIFNENRSKIRLYCDDVIFFESQLHALWIHTKEHKYKLSKTMSELCRSLDNELFFRVHNSYTVNFKYIKEIKENKITLYDSDVKIPIGRLYKKQFVESFINFKERKYII